MIHTIVFLLTVSYCFCLKQPSLQCLVCQQVVEAIEHKVASEDPNKVYVSGGFRIQPDGTQKQSKVKYAGSILHLGEILEDVCSVMDNFAQATHKETGSLTLLNLQHDVEKLSEHDLIPDADLNEILKHHCNSLIEEYEDDIVEVFKTSASSGEKNADQVCRTVTGLCGKVDHSEL